MNVFMSEQVVFDALVDAAEFITKLPSFCLVQLNVVHVSDERKFYQVVVYCFDGDVDLVDYL